MSGSGPGCVKTPLLCYDSLVILRGKLMRRFVEQADRGQRTLLPECLDDFIDESNPVRVIDVFVDSLDLAEMRFEGAEPAATGRPSYHPSVLLKLYIYGYLNRVQSSRRLEREAGRNVEVMWLLGRLAPDHKTIADFRKDNGLALRRGVEPDARHVSNVRARCRGGRSRRSACRVTVFAWKLFSRASTGSRAAATPATSCPSPAGRRTSPAAALAPASVV